MSEAITPIELTKRLLIFLEEVLGEDGLNVLGKYEYLNGDTVLGESSSIEISYPTLSSNTTKRVKENSGIECVIDPTPQNYISHFKRGTQHLRYYQVILIQFNPLGASKIIEAIEFLYSHPRLFFKYSPIIKMSEIQGNREGYEPPRAVIYPCQNLYLPSFR